MPTAFVRISTEILAASRRGPLITPNERLARELSRALNVAHIEAGDDAWLPETVTSWRALLQQIYGDQTEVLTSPGLKLLLRRTAPNALQGLVREAHEAWQLNHQYRVTCRAAEPWFAQTREQLTSMGCITEAQLEDALHGVDLPWHHLCFVGFEHFTPAQSELIEKWRQDGCEFVHVPPEESLTPIRRLEFASSEQELAASAWWARTVLQDDPDATVGVLIPDLPRRHSAVMRQFGAILDPQNGARSRTFDVGAGPPLNQHPLWLDAERLLSGLHTQITAADVQRLSRSRHFDWQPGAHELPWLLSWQDYLARSADDQLTMGIEEWAGERPPGSVRPLYDWISRDLRMLAHLGWGRARAGSRMYQLHRSATEALQNLANQPPANVVMSHEDALRIMTSTLADIPSVEERPAAPVQLLGYLESTGLAFTHLWVTGLSDAELPAPPRPNALFEVQDLLAAGVRRSNHAEESAFAQSRLRQWSAAASTLVVSHALTTRSGVARPSPLVAEIQPTPYEHLFGRSTPRPTAHSYTVDTAETHELTDAWQPTPIAGGRLPGGSGLLQSQLTCPFQAFARYRLGIDVTPNPHTFADALQVGNLIHAALEQLFERFSKADSLAAVSQRDVAQVVSSTLGGLADYWPSTVTAQFESWLCGRIFAWIQYDESVGVANVMALEQPHLVKLGDFEVKAVVDRLDVSDDGLIVIDYKTGKVPSSQQVFTTDEQMRQTQLPLYALINPAVQAVLYAKVHEPPRYSGLRSARSPSLPGVAATEQWQNLVDHWRRELTTLAENFATGPATPTPAAARACTTCQVRGLCRQPVDQRV